MSYAYWAPPADLQLPLKPLIETLQDVRQKLIDLSSTEWRNLVIQAATGVLSSATLLQPGGAEQGLGVELTGDMTILALSGAMLQVSVQDGCFILDNISYLVNLITVLI